MNTDFRAQLLHELQATDLIEQEIIQHLWSGYGTIKRYEVQGAAVRSIVIKHVCPPSVARHPRGWNSDRSHQRKLRSYEVETAWYRSWSHRCATQCRIPKCYALEPQGAEFYIALEDLRASGFVATPTSVSLPELRVCIEWLAHFHATFMDAVPTDLWEVGTYWHLDTRPDELARVQDERLRSAANGIDLLLKRARFQTIVHGDAKLANFCFSENGKRVAAVDFQYAGRGCGMKDLIYLLGGCLTSEECAKFEESLLGHYFDTLGGALRERRSKLDFGELESEWRDLYAPAWADFHRFLKGWSPDHWKLNSYGERLTREVLGSLCELD